MRNVRMLLALAILLLAAGLACARLTVKIKTVGYEGYYRARTVVPVLVEVQNTGDTIKGEFRVVTPDRHLGALPDTYRVQATIPKGAKQLRFLYVTPRLFTREMMVTFVADNQVVTTDIFRRCQELYQTDRLLVVVGGTGSSMNIVNGQSITVPEIALPRPWDGVVNYEMQRLMSVPVPSGRGYHGTGGTVRMAYASREMLPDNAEAYGSVSMLALMADVTENTLSADAQAAIPLWVASGGHLLVAGGGVPSRLQAPFFAGLSPRVTGTLRPGGERLTNADGGTADTAPLAAGRVTWLNYDPDLARSSDWRKISVFYGKLMTRDVEFPLPFLLRDGVSAATMVRNLKPPNLQLIIIFLVVYLVMLVPVNYFVLKKMDKRELAWVTTPAIVLVFTVGAYGIGYATKGHRLVTNLVSLVETTSGQNSAEAVSQLLIFSPSRASYRLHLGETALAVREMNDVDEESYYGGRPSRITGLPLTLTPQGLLLERLSVNMWAFRQVAMAHALPLGNGFSAALKSGQPSSTPRATGTVTNGTNLNFPLCELYVDGAWVGSFAVKPGQTVTMNAGAATPKVKLGEDGDFMLENLRNRMKSQLSSTPRLRKGFVLVGYTNDPKAAPPLKINDRQPTAQMTVVVTHL